MTNIYIYIYIEDGKYYTLATDYIKDLMEQAKEYKEQKTIRLYEAQKAKYEAQKAKYELAYLQDKTNIIWKSFKLGDLFEFTMVKKWFVLKNYNLLDQAQNNYLKVVTSSKNPSYKYINKDDIDPKIPIFSNQLTINNIGSVGYCFYHDYDFVATPNTYVINYKNENLQKNFNSLANHFLAKIITNVFNNGIYGYAYGANKENISRETILLPCLKVSSEDEYIWQENNKYYILALNYISYIYFQGKVNYNQKLVDKYTYKY
ncbi:restriction endonuclease subunit S [Mycoplasma iguanae]|uniref:Restriction endonuclease subunit S n=1 Tax=Mycoplasma iguanae TaxID=292461 RepID=A0ABY5R8B7_9MOLU|nr:restriction endonuclease subunit S [Mycoplasma iguanae]UVD81551.1 restriction endonuclease subunit S [Mycoplasma iguanae]